MEDIRPVFGKRIRELRQVGGLTQESLAERADLHWTYISGIERGKRSPRLHIIARLAAALGVRPVDLFAESLPARKADATRSGSPVKKASRKRPNRAAR